MVVGSLTVHSVASPGPSVPSLATVSSVSKIADMMEMPAVW